MQSAPDFNPGHKLSRYELLFPLASGGMGTVHLARAVGLGGFERVVAVKCCHPHLASDPDFATLFLSEARLAARIHHPNVVPTLDVGDEGGLFLVMDYVEGARVSDLESAEQARGGVVPVPVALRVMVDALEGLHAAHELRGDDGAPLNLVHRDVSPQNVLVGIDGITRILDFGVAKANSRATITRDGQVRGKLGYMPPEQMCEDEPGRRADIYAAGVVLWELLAGRRLFGAKSDRETMMRVLNGTVPSLRSARPEVPAALEAVVLRALDRDPERRFATAADFAQALEESAGPPAAARVVGTYVQQLMAEPLSARRALLLEHKSRADAAGPGRDVLASTPASRSARAAVALATPVRDKDAGATPATLPAMASEVPAEPREPDALRARTPRRGWGFAAIFAGVAVVAGAAVVASRRASSSARDPIAVSAPAPTVHAPELPAPTVHPPALQPPSAPSVVPSAGPAATAPSAVAATTASEPTLLAPVPVEPSSAPSHARAPAAGTRRRARRAARPRGHAAGASTRGSIVTPFRADGI